MTHSLTANKVTLDEAVLDYSIGGLSPAKRAILSCQREISEAVDQEISFHEFIAASVMVDHEVALSDGFFKRFETRLSDEVNVNQNQADIKVIENNRTPQMLQRLSGQRLSEIKWKMLALGVSIHDIIGNRTTKDQERLYLLRAKGGKKMPVHSHNGEEWTLVLTGGYEAEGVMYNRGDLHISNDNDEHAPHIAEGEDCICLVMTQARIKMKSLVPRLVQPLIGI